MFGPDFDTGRAMRGKMITVEIKEREPSPKDVIIKMPLEKARALRQSVLQAAFGSRYAPTDFSVLSEFLDALTNAGLPTA